MRGYLDELHNKRMSPYEKIELLEAIRAQVQAAWRTDEIRRQKPTPQVRRYSRLYHPESYQFPQKKSSAG